MRPRFAVSALVALSLGSAAQSGCGGTKPTPSARGPALELDGGSDTLVDENSRVAAMTPLINRHMTALEEMVAIVDTNQGDCPAMAMALDAFLDQNASLFEEIAQAETDPGNSPVLAKLYHPVSARSDELSTRAGDGIGACAGDPAMRAVIEHMPFH